MTAKPSQAIPEPASSAGRPDHADLIEVTFSPAEPQLIPSVARAVLALLQHAQEAAQAKDRPESEQA